MTSAREGGRYAQFVSSKLGEDAVACEDVVRIADRLDGLRIAASDGATTSSFSREWATLLAQWYAERPVAPSSKALRRTIPVLGKQWLNNVTSRPLPWHAQEKVQQGAFATILGVTIGNSHWKAIALGDTCLFHVRNGSLLFAFPYTTAEAFSMRPFLAGSVQRANLDIEKHIITAEGVCEPGDLIVVATDGFSQWLLRNIEAAIDQWELFADGSSARLARVVDEERRERRMRNDDVACVWYRA